MIVRYFLPTVDAVVLKRKYSQRFVRFDQRERCLFRGFDYGRPFFSRKVEQCFRVAAGNDAALTNLELRRVNDRQSVLRFRDYRPFLVSAGQTFTKLTGLLPW